MKTVILNAPEQLRLIQTNEPDAPDADEAIVKVHRVGICGTDLHAFQGHQAFFDYPRILGHELGVEVVTPGTNAAQYGLKQGDRCAVIPYLHDGTCVACRRGKTNCCVNMQVLGVHIDGGMREYIRVPMSLLLKSDLPYEQLAQVEMLSIGAHAVRRAQLSNDENVLVIGAGPIGLGVIAFAKQQAKRVLALDISDSRLSFVNAQGLADVINGKDDVHARITELLGGDYPTAVFDATGNARSMMTAVDYCAHGAKLVYVGHTKGEISFMNPEIHKRELSILCSRNATKEDFLHVMRTLENKQLDITPWITHRASPETLINDFASYTNPETGVIKALLEF